MDGPNGTQTSSLPDPSIWIDFGPFFIWIDLETLEYIHLHKTGANYDPSNKENAINHINTHKKNGEIATGLLYIDQSMADFHELQDTVDKSLNELNSSELCPGNETLQNINQTFK